MDKTRSSIVDTQKILDELKGMLAQTQQIPPGGSISPDPSFEAYVASIVQQNNYTFINPEISKISSEASKLGGLTKTEDFLDPKLLGLISGLDPSVTDEIKKNIKQGVIDEATQQVIVVKNIAIQIRKANVASMVALIKKFIVENNKLLTLIAKMDPSYPNKINSKVVNLEFNRFVYDRTKYKQTPAPPPAPPSSALNVKYEELDKYIKWYNLSLLTAVPKSDDPIFAFKRDQTNKIRIFLLGILTTIETDLPTIIDTFLNQISPQIGGGPADTIRSAIDAGLRRKILIMQLTELINLYTNKLANLNAILNKPSANVPVVADIDYFSPFVALLQYNTGNITPYDNQLIKYCQQIGLSTNVTLAIYFAQRKADIQQILAINNPQYSSSMMNILRLKKMSAHQKFKMNYGMRTESDLKSLSEKKILY